ncbi:hypothetical protein LCGC14_0208040 [marine sediment metagenome]|uniref:Uncharacterized protein n=1 Tax=marine sediment metagenome TaxID=412755 RepID=A0A0F9XJS0_9ZZZZ
MSRNEPGTGEVLQVDGDWQLEDHPTDEGPVILHNCRFSGREGDAYIVNLNREFPMCRCCGAGIPNSMISGFSLLNYNKATDDEYFVDPSNEILDFVYNGHLRDIWNDSAIEPESIDREQVLAAIAEWKGQQELT